MTELEPKIAKLYIQRPEAPQSLNWILTKFEGILGDKYQRKTRIADVRDPIELRGSEILNDRMWSGISTEELQRLCSPLNIPHIKPIHLRPNIVFEGIPDLSNLPAGTKLVFPRTGTILRIDAQNMPCSNPAKNILADYPELDYEVFKEFFKVYAIGLRGVVGSIYKPGQLAVGDPVRIELPKRV